MYTFAKQKMFLPIGLVDQSAKSDADVLFTFYPAKKITILGLGVVPVEAFGVTASKFSVEVDDVEVAVTTVPALSALGVEAYQEAADANGAWPNAGHSNKVEIVCKDVNSQDGTAYLVLYYQECPENV